MSAGKFSRSFSLGSSISSISVNSSASQAQRHPVALSDSEDTDQEDGLSPGSSTSNSSSSSRIKLATADQVVEALRQPCCCPVDSGSCLSEIPRATHLIQSMWSSVQSMSRSTFKRFAVTSLVNSCLRDGESQNIQFDHSIQGNKICWKSWCTLYQVPQRTYREWKANMIHVLEQNPDVACGVWCTAWDVMCAYGGGRVKGTATRTPPKKLAVIAWMKQMFRFLDKSPEEGQRWYVDLPAKYELFEQWNKAQQLSPTPTLVSKSTFMDVWRSEFPHVRLRKVTNQHKCNTCSSFLERASTCTTDGQLAAVQREWREHLDLQDKERRVYYKHKQKAQSFPSRYLSIIVDGMDQTKTLLPRSRTHAKVLKPENQVKFKLQGVLVHNHGMYSYIVPPWVHGTANLIISTLHRTLQQLTYLPPVLYLQLDGASENKCDAVLAYSDWLVEAGIFTKVKKSYLHVGHTHEDIDQQFSVVARYLKKRTTWTPQDLLQSVKDALAPSKYHEENQMLPSVHVSMHNVNWDVSGWLSPHIDRRLANYRRECHVFRFAAFDNNKVYMHYKLRACTKDWYPSLKLPGSDTALRYKDGPYEGAVMPGLGIRVLTSLPESDSPQRMEPWNTKFCESGDPRHVLQLLVDKVLPELVPADVQDRFTREWTTCLNFDLSSQSLDLTEQNCWKPAGTFEPAFHRGGAAGSESSNSSDISSGLIVEPVTFTGYTLSQKAKAAMEKDTRKQTRTNTSIEPGQLLAVVKVINSQLH
jgi:hypothetical protein